MLIFLSNYRLNNPDIKQMRNKYLLNYSTDLFDVGIGRICHWSPDKNAIIKSTNFCRTFVNSEEEGLLRGEPLSCNSSFGVEVNVQGDRRPGLITKAVPMRGQDNSKFELLFSRLLANFLPMC